MSTAELNLRESGRRLCVAWRGVPAERALLLPLPLGRIERSLEPAEAKTRLGLPPETVVMLTAVSPWKYTAIEPPGFVDINLPIIERHGSCGSRATGVG